MPVVEQLSREVPEFGAEECWYVAQVVSGMEKLQSEKLQSRGFGTMLPLDRVRRRRRRGRGYVVEWVERPAFVGYLFVQMRGHSFFELHEAEGVIGTIKHADAPAALSRRDLERVLASGREVLQGFAAGQEVQLTAGALAGQIGLVQVDLGASVTVLMQLLGGQRAIDVSAGSLI